VVQTLSSGGSCEHGNEPSIKGWEFFDQLNDVQFRCLDLETGRVLTADAPVQPLGSPGNIL
jgi:hypothetical protein